MQVIFRDTNFVGTVVELAYQGVDPVIYVVSLISAYGTSVYPFDNFNSALEQFCEFVQVGHSDVEFDDVPF